MFTITKEFHFCAAHRIEGLPGSHPCSRLHGHNYLVKVELSNADLSNGMVLDYGELKPIQNYLDKHWDHRCLNDLLDFNPTAENLAKQLYFIIVFELEIPNIKAVEVSETPKTNARYEANK